ncbi:neuronal acetylcholine receptor subunit beta-4-like [Saccostrea echinata]|uniref:neuronal acetylcholine receptor subunit beta-4-like n=1 Tax=Saccostrea echinata TaxID=191078 RepID=UPI002A8235D5|nr:neuronal acetylcholine receptor subunit beta-4-like [Saccostrea echinata]
MGIVSGQTGTNLKDLYTYLFTTIGYNKDIRPATNQGSPTQVSVDLLLTGLQGLNEAHQQMTSMGILTIKWKDEFLTWTPSSYGGATYIDVPQGLVWKPDIQVQNGLTDFAELGGSFMNVRVFSTGDVIWTPYKVFDTKCLIEIRSFPFDRQECSINFIAWNSDINSVNITQGTNGMQLDDDLYNGQWTLSNPTTNVIIDDDESKISFKLTIERKPKTYVINIIVPMMFLVVLDVFTFALPIDSGEKMGYSVTIMLSMSIFMTIVASLLPPTSYSTSYIEIYIILDVVLGTIILVITTLTIRIHYRTQEIKIPPWVQKLTVLSWKLQGRPSQNSVKQKMNSVTKLEVVSVNDTDGENAKPMVGNSEIVLWTDVTSAIDYYMFWLFLFIISLSTAVLLGLASS